MNRFVLLSALFLSGCSALPIVETGAKIVVSHYCTDTPAIGRSMLRARINAVIAPDSIAITCDGD
jgi:hypothetical protein